MVCITCEATSSRYKCRFCRASYCSSECYKRHRDAGGPAKIVCSALQQPVEVVQDHGETEEKKKPVVGQRRKRERSSEVEEVELAPPAQPSSDVAEDNTDDTLVMLTDKHLDALTSDARIRQSLRTPELQSMIKAIDSSRSRLEALDAALHNSTDFSEFCSQVMATIARAEHGR